MNDVASDMCRPDPSALFEALGDETVFRMVREGDREAQWSLGISFMSEAGVVGEPLGTGGRSPEADVGLALCTARFPAAHWTEALMWSPDALIQLS